MLFVTLASGLLSLHLNKSEFNRIIIIIIKKYIYNYSHVIR
jgi:hypothetical protein